MSNRRSYTVLETGPTFRVVMYDRNGYVDLLQGGHQTGHGTEAAR